MYAYVCSNPAFGGFAYGKADPEMANAANVHVFHWDDENPEPKLLQSTGEGLTVGQRVLDVDRKVLYICDETDKQPGEIGGGGTIAVFKIKDDGTLDWVQRMPSMGVNPAYACVTKDKKFLLAANHTLRNYVTHIVRKEDGTLGTETLFDNSSLVLFTLNEDGTINAAIDADVRYGTGKPGFHTRACYHSIIENPTEEVYLACENGTDLMMSYKIDKQNGKLIRCCDLVAPNEGNGPRYSAFSPKWPYAYVTTSHYPELHIVKYDTETGNLERVQVVQLMDAAEYGLEEKRDWAAPSDIALSADGEWLYVTLRFVNRIVAVKLNENGTAEVRQNIPYGGDNNRGLALDPSGKCLYAANTGDGTVVKMEIKDDGLLGEPERFLDLPYAASLVLMND